MDCIWIWALGNVLPESQALIHEEFYLRHSVVFHLIGRVRGQNIELDKRMTKALDGIEGFSHIIVLFWLDKARKPDIKIHPKGVQKIPKIGYLSTRTPHRHNPIGMTVVQLVKRQKNILMVKGLDAWDGTPILDIKPYTKREAVKNYRMPGWVKLLDQQETDPLRRYAS